MKSYLELLNEFEVISLELQNLIQKFPAERREEIIFDKWSLKNVVSHLNHWMVHNINCLEAVIKGETPYWQPDIDEYNHNGVKIRQQMKWSEIYDEFNILLNKQLESYCFVKGFF